MSNMEMDFKSKKKMLKHCKEGVHLVNFWAPWCGPCRMMAANFEDTEGANLIKVNIDNNEKLTYELNIRSIPATVAIKDGEIVSSSVGALSRDAITAIVTKATVNTEEE